MKQICLKMAKVASVFAFMVLLAVVVEGRDWRFESVKRVKRGYNQGFGSNSDTYGRSDEHNGSNSRERLGCSDEQGGSYGSGSHEPSYNRDGHQNENRRHHPFSKATASASASASAGTFNQDHKINL